MSPATPWTFEPDGRGRLVTALADEERAVLLDVVDGVIELLGGGDVLAVPSAGAHPLDALRLAPEAVDPPTDPAVRRLLPDASRADAEVSAEFRRLTEADLRTAKVAGLGLFRDALERAQPTLVVSLRDGGRVAAALTDVRLVLSERLGVRTDADAEALYRSATGADGGAGEEASARRFLATVYVALSMLQESLVEELLAALPEGPRPGHDQGPGRSPR